MKNGEKIIMQYLIYRVKQDKRYKNGYRPNSFQYVSDFKRNIQDLHPEE